MLTNLPDMKRYMLKSKLHKLTVTGKQLNYEGSIAIDSELLRLADILPGEQVHVLNLNTGSRVVTYAIPAEKNSGTVMLNGPAARAGEVGDTVIVLSYCCCDDDEAKKLKPIVITVDNNNKPRKHKNKTTASGINKS
jgi:aspartate 1-decarboxylase